jgi:c-di-GMP-binding flagellar brake protein YcgR
MANGKTRSVGPKIILETREKLDLHLRRDEKNYTFFSRVVEHTSTHILIEYPVAVEGGGVLMVGDWVHVSFTRDDAAWAFMTRIVAKIRGNQPLMKLAPPEKIERHQRRRYVRVDWPSAVSWWPIHQPYSNPKPNDVIGGEANGSIINISAGGVLIAGDHPPPVGEYIILMPKAKDWPLDGSLVGKIVWREHLPPEHKYQMYAGVDFRDHAEFTRSWNSGHLVELPDHLVLLTPAVRQRLMQFVHHLQIELRQKGLL